MVTGRATGGSGDGRHGRGACCAAAVSRWLCDDWDRAGQSRLTFWLSSRLRTIRRGSVMSSIA